MSEAAWVGADIRIEYKDGSECAGHITEQFTWYRPTFPLWLENQTGPLRWVRSFLIRATDGFVRTVLMAERDSFFEAQRRARSHYCLVPDSLVMIDVTDEANRRPIVRMHVRPKESAIAL